MAKEIDIRALQGGGRSGVEVYIEGFLHDFFVEKKEHERDTVILWINAASDVILPDFIDDYLNLPNVRLVHTKIPNKILNVLCSIFRWPKIDGLHGMSGVDEIWVLDPRPAPVSKNVRKNIVVHDLSAIKFPCFFSLRSKLWFLTVRLKKELREADAIYAVSEFTKKEISDFDPILQNKIIVKYPTLASDVNQPVFSKEFLQTFCDKRKIPSGRLLFTVSTLEPRKNIDVMIEKFLRGEFPNFDYLVIAGKKNERIFNSAKYVIHDSVIFTGHISEDEKWALYRLADAFICLSGYEGFGIPVKDAMNFKLPLILGDIPVFREITAGYRDVTWI